MNSLPQILDDVPFTPSNCGDLWDIHGPAFVHGGAIHGDFFGTKSLVEVRSDTGVVCVKSDLCQYSIGSPHEI